MSHPLCNRVSDCLLEVLSIQKPLSGEEGLGGEFKGGKPQVSLRQEERQPHGTEMI